MAHTLLRSQQQSCIEQYMTDLKTSPGHSSEEFKSWPLSIEESFQINRFWSQGHSFCQAKRNLKILYSLPLQKLSLNALNGKMRAEFFEAATASHASLALINCNQQSDESLTIFTYRWNELFLQSSTVVDLACLLPKLPSLLSFAVGLLTNIAFLE